MAEFGAPEFGQFGKRTEGEIHPFRQVRMDANRRRENVQVRVIHAANAFAGVGGGAVFKNQRGDAPAFDERLLDCLQQAFEVVELCRREVGE